jgi:hypothetical protein
VQRLINADLVGPQSTTALQHQNDLADTAELVRRTTFTADEQELKQRVEALRGAGWSQIVIAIAPGEERAIEDWARIKRAFE